MIRRRLFNLEHVALLLCVATAIFWARSYFRSYDLTYSAGHQLLWVAGGQGVFHVGWDSNYGPVSGGLIWSTGDPEEIIWDLDHSRAGFGFTYKDERPTTFRVIGIPLWSIALLGAAGFSYCTVRRRAKIPEGCCRRCGYNLTANTSGVCPECGAAIAIDGKMIA